MRMVSLQTKFQAIAGLLFFLCMFSIAFLTFYQMSEIINNRLFYLGKDMSAEEPPLDIVVSFTFGRISDSASSIALILRDSLQIVRMSPSHDCDRNRPTWSWGSIWQRT